MPKRNREKTMEEIKEKMIDGYINGYIMSFGECSLALRAKDVVRLANDSFSFGYAQGMKAAKAEKRKAGN